MIANFNCAVHPREVTLAAVTISTGETIGMCLVCYAAWCADQRKSMNYGTADQMDEAMVRIKLSQGATGDAAFRDPTDWEDEDLP